MKIRVLFISIFSVLFFNQLNAQDNPKLTDVFTVSSGNITVVDWLNVIKKTDLKYEDLTKTIKFVDEHKRTIEEHKRTIDDQKRTIEDQKRTLNDHSKTINEQKRTIDDLSKTIKEMQRSINDLERDVKDLKRK